MKKFPQTEPDSTKYFICLYLIKNNCTTLRISSLLKESVFILTIVKWYNTFINDKNFPSLDKNSVRMLLRHFRYMPVASDNPSDIFILLFMHPLFFYFSFLPKITTNSDILHKIYIVLFISQHFSNFIFRNAIQVLGATVISLTHC